MRPLPPLSSQFIQRQHNDDRRWLRFEFLEDRRVLSGIHGAGDDLTGKVVELDTAASALSDRYVQVSTLAAGLADHTSSMLESLNRHAVLSPTPTANHSFSLHPSDVTASITDALYELVGDGETGTTGAAAVDFNLLGDIDGNGAVDETAVRELFANFGATQSTERSLEAANADLSGHVGTTDTTPPFRGADDSANSSSPDGDPTVCGNIMDIDGNGQVDLQDAIAIVNTLHNANGSPDTRIDVNGDGKGSLQDALSVINAVHQQSRQLQVEQSVPHTDTAFAILPAIEGEASEEENETATLTEEERREIAHFVADIILSFVSFEPTEEIKQIARGTILDFLTAISSPFVDAVLKGLYLEILADDV